MRKSIATIGILVVLLVSLFGTAGAQGELPPDTAPEEEVAETVVFTHPVVKVLSAYFDREKKVVENEGETDLGETDLEGETPEGETPEGETPVVEKTLIGEQIATLHEEGMGFGVLVKLFAMAEAAQEACADAEAECTPVTAEELVASFKDGAGMGALFKEYGKPALLGVGHVKQALKKMEKEQAQGENADDEVGEGEEDEDILTADDDSGKDKDKDKDKVKDKKPLKKPVKDKSKAPKNKP